jgi:GGDEF domain-containing protein
LACADDLDSLGTALAQARDRCRRLERALGDMQAALARSQAELADTRHGERSARHLALHDSLTGLPNRRCFGERLDRALAQVEPARSTLAVLYVDLDGLKAGHAFFSEPAESRGHAARGDAGRTGLMTSG